MQMNYTPETFTRKTSFSTVSEPHLSNQEQNSKPRRNKNATVIGWILRGGAILSATIIFCGMLLLFVHGGVAAQSFHAFPHTLSQVLIGVLALQPEAVIELGILLLIATPVITVSASAIAFAVEHDRPFVVIALIVLAILLTSFVLGKGAA
jgi:uncharacterized membrane protein